MTKVIDKIVNEIADRNPELFDPGAKRGTGSKAQDPTDTDTATSECVHVAAGEVCLHCNPPIKVEQHKYAGAYTLVCGEPNCTVGHKKPLTLRGTRNMVIAAVKASLSCPCGGNMRCQRLTDDIEAAAAETKAAVEAKVAQEQSKAAKAAQILADAEGWLTEDDDDDDEDDAPEEVQPEAPTEEAQPEAAAAEEEDNDDELF